MFDIECPKPNERVILAGLITSKQDPALFKEDIQEMVQLCSTAGADVIKTFIQKLSRPVASTYMGSGKLKEISELMDELECDTLVVDAELTPGQTRTIEKIIKGKVIDRSQLILDIFALNARTNESRIQVELAQLRTLYPRLTHAWSHFSKQVGGIGTRGPGEKQLEVDRRMVQKKISDLRKKLKKIEKSRHTQRKSRNDEFNISLVGYTNVGKSSILNAISNSSVLVENRLFATLETTTRKTFIKEIGNVVVSDTVGFIRKLPHHLVASFMSTLEVVHNSDLLLIVMDGVTQFAEQQLETVNEVIKELGAENVKRLMVFNKCDLIKDKFELKRMKLAFPDAIFISAFNPDDILFLKKSIAKIVSDIKKEREKEFLIAQETKAAKISAGLYY